MPFTGSHPVAVLPFVGRLGLPTSALVIGSIAPDLPYYLPLPVTSAQTHSLVGVLGADLMLGVCAYLVWHLLLVAPLIWAAPEGLQRRIPDHLRRGITTRLASAKDLGLLCLALVVGALTHVVWDAFTHTGMWGEQAIPGLNAPFFGLTLTRWLHLVSSIAGLGYLAWFMARWWRQAPEVGSGEPVRPAVRWVPVAALVAWATWSTAELVIGRLLAPGPVAGQMLFIDSLVEFLSTVLVGVVGLAVVWHVARAVQSRILTG